MARHAHEGRRHGRECHEVRLGDFGQVKPGSRERGTGIPIDAATPRQARPGGTHGPLESSQQGARPSSDVLEDMERASGPQNAANLRCSRGGIGHRAQDVGDEDGVDGRVREGDLLSHGVNDIDIDTPVRRCSHA